MKKWARNAFAGLVLCGAVAAVVWDTPNELRLDRTTEAQRTQRGIAATQKLTTDRADGTDKSKGDVNQVPPASPAVGGIGRDIIPVKTGIKGDVDQVPARNGNEGNGDQVPLGRGIKGDVKPATANSGSTENSSLQEAVRKAEYNITRQDTCVIDGMPGGLHAANRANNLRAYFREDGVQLVERESSDPNWDLRVRLEAWGHDGAMQEAAEVEPTSADHTNRVTYTRPGIEEWFQNTEAGLEHGFTIMGPVNDATSPHASEETSPLEGGSRGMSHPSPFPLRPSPLILTFALSGNISARNTSAPTAIEFATPDGAIVAQLAQLDARDANGTAIPATLSAKAGHTEIRLAIDDASYPITVKGLYVPPPIGDWQAYGEQVDALFGSSVADAGDVNGDGYADVIVGAPIYDNGHPDEGAAFVFLGSPSGIVGTSPATAAAILESDQTDANMGGSVSGAGDVNGDGYADVIVGAPYFDNGQPSEGAAFVFLGSPSGIVGTDPATAAAILESDQAEAEPYPGAGYVIGPQFGSSVSGAGDVNGDGYADVIVGAPGYANATNTNGEMVLVDGESAVGVWMLSVTDGFGADVGTLNSWSLEFEGIGTFASIDTPIPIPDYPSPGITSSIVITEDFAITDLNVPVDITHTFRGDLVVELTSPAGTTLLLHNQTGGGAENIQWTFDDEGANPPDGSGSGSTGAAFLFLGSALGLIGTNPATAAAMLESDQANTYMGVSVSGAGDVNGDGYADVIVGAPYFDNGQVGEGAAFVFLGSPSGIVGTDPATAAAILESDQQNANMGLSVSGAGDVNGDGYADVIVGAPGYGNGQSAEGAAFVFLGSPSGVVGTDPATAAAILESDQQNANMGSSVSGAGDVNDDGYADVIVGAPSFANRQLDVGAAFVFLGSPSGVVGTDPATAVARLESDRALADMGFSVSGAGDVNGDGYADVIVGAPGYGNGQLDEGAAFVLLGSPSGVAGTNPATAAAILESDQEGAAMGESVSGAGDVNGDGYADLIVGAIYFDNGQLDEGAAFVFLGSPSGVVGTDPGTAVAILESDRDEAYMGVSVSGAGDVNGDGYADVIVGALYFDNGQLDEGAAFVFLGSPSGVVGTNPATAAAILESDQEGAAMGESVSGAGDVNGDGYADVIVGAPWFNNDQDLEGAAFVFLGSPSGVVGTNPATAAAMLESDQVYGWMGWSVSDAGDVNGDGYADVIVGAPLFDNGQGFEGGFEGAAFVFLGSPSGIVGTNPATAAVVLESDQGVAEMGESVSGAGDVNGDGYADVIVGASVFDNGQDDEGAAFVFLGSPSGVVGTGPATAAAILESNQDEGHMGRSVSGAGDVNGDGYADVIVGAASDYVAYDNGQSEEGAAFLFLGSPSGLVGTNPATAAAMLDSDQDYASMGESVSGAGDVNGDGYADVIVGALGFDNGQPDEGAAFVFLGNTEASLTHAPSLHKPDNTLIATPGINAGTSDLRIRMEAFNPPTGAMAVRLEWEIAPYGTPFDETGTDETPVWIDVSTANYIFDEALSLVGDTNGWRWRARVLYAPLNVFDDVGGSLTLKPGLALPPKPPHGPWFSPQWATVGPSDFRTSGYRPPTDPAIQVSEGDLYTTDELLCEVVGESVSPAVPPKDSIQYEYTWMNDLGRTVVHIGDSFDALEASETFKHETWTCIVRAYDGVQYSHLPASATTPAILNTPPAPPSVELPMLQSTSANLVARIVEVSEDPDIDPIQYDFDWYLKREGAETFALYRDGALSTAISSQVNDTETEPGDAWYCVVTPHDGETNGAAATSGVCTIVLGGVEPSIVTLNLSPSTVTLGQSLTASGNVFPVPEGTPNAVFESTSPSGAVSGLFPEGTVVSGGAYAKAFVPTEASEGRAPWQLRASWAGDDTYQAATSAMVEFEVLKAQPAIGMTLSRDAALLGLDGAEDFVVRVGLGAFGKSRVEQTLLSVPRASAMEESVMKQTRVSVLPFADKMSATQEPDCLDCGAGFQPAGLGGGTDAGKMPAPQPANTRGTQSPFEGGSRGMSRGNAEREIGKSEAVGRGLPHPALSRGERIASLGTEVKSLDSLLANRVIRLSALRPDATTTSPLTALTDASGVATFTRADLISGGVAFDQPGAWRFKAEFAGDDNLRLAATEDFDSTDARLTVKRGAGYAVIVLGRIDEYAEGHPEHARTTDFIYETLLARNFQPEDIRYLRDYLPAWEETPDPEIATLPATEETLRESIEVWAKQSMTLSPAPLYVIMAGHGLDGRFYLDVEGTGEREYVSPDELATSLHILQTSLDGEAAAQDVVVIDGSCYSGSFIPAVSGEGRTVITSTSADQISFRGVDSNPDDDDPTRDGEFFLMELFRDLGEGRTLAEAFDRASQATVEYTADSRGQSGEDERPPQVALLDDDGDGAGSPGPLAGADGDRAAEIVLGVPSNAAFSELGWFTASPAVTVGSAGFQPADVQDDADAGKMPALRSKALDVPLFAETTGRAIETGDTAWVEIKTPAYVDGVAADPDYAEFQRVAQFIGPIIPDAQIADGEKTRYEWSAAALDTAGAVFDTPGTYKAYYFLRDGRTGLTAAYLVTNIYVPRAGNRAPGAVTLRFPADGGVTTTTTFLAWSGATDPDGDAVTYRVEISTDEAFPVESTLVIEGLTETFTNLANENALQDQTAYFWRVIPVDQYGLEAEGNPVFDFQTDNTNPAAPGAITGEVTRASGGPLAGVTVRVLDSGFLIAQDTTTADGSYFIGSVEPGRYSVEVNAEAQGLGTEQKDRISIRAGDVEEVNFTLGTSGEGEGEGEGCGAGAISPLIPLRSGSGLLGDLLVFVLSAALLARRRVSAD